MAAALGQSLKGLLFQLSSHGATFICSSLSCCGWAGFRPSCFCIWSPHRQQQPQTKLSVEMAASRHRRTHNYEMCMKIVIIAACVCAQMFVRASDNYGQCSDFVQTRLLVLLGAFCFWEQLFLIDLEPNKPAGFTLHLPVLSTTVRSVKTSCVQLSRNVNQCEICMLRASERFPCKINPFPSCN